MSLHGVYVDLVRSDVPNIIQVISGTSLIAAVLLFFRHLICKQHGCYRVAWHRVEGTTYKTCTKHATGAVHHRLWIKHAAELPDQHDLLNN
jgi:hypothetical protein